MELINFTEEYKTHLLSIDYEHEKLVNYINEIIKAKDLGDSAHLVIEVTLDELINYTVYHFKHEEELMLKFNYPEYESHKEAHETLKLKALKFKERFDNKENITDELIVFLKDWLLDHIVGTDHKYAPVFKANGVK